MNKGVTARQRHGKHVSAAAIQHETVKEPSLQQTERLCCWYY
jgi:hypothetical protein